MAAHKFSQFFLPLSCAVFVAVLIFSLFIGLYPLSPGEVLGNLGRPFAGAQSDTPWIVVNILRLPRVLLVAISGMGLALAGAALQGLFRNPLVGPEILGVSSGACFGGVLAMSLGLTSLPLVTSFAFAMGCAAMLLVFCLAAFARQNSIIGLVLAGVIVSGFFAALTGLSTYMADPETKLPGIIYWLMGSFASASYENVAFLAAVCGAAMLPLLGLSWRINLLSLGEADARSLGVNIQRLRWIIVFLTALIVAAQVSVSGGVGWVGLVIPHLARMFVGPEHSKLLPSSTLLGGIYLLLVDDLARSLTSHEIPVGLLTSLIGTPVFAFFFIRLKGRGWNSD